LSSSLAETSLQIVDVGDDALLLLKQMQVVDILVDDIVVEVGNIVVDDIVNDVGDIVVDDIVGDIYC